ncbi:MAG: hypothetical protein ACJA2S_003561 [Cyclobacteriaceae bacterium]
MGKRSILSFLFSLLFFVCSAQEVITDGFFLADSMKIGEEVEYSLYIQYPKNSEVIFPDSTFDFFPFEYYSKRFFPTRVDSLLAYDSVVYSVASFEIDKVQYFQLPVFLLKGKDSINIMPELDSIYLMEMVIQVPDSLVLRENIAFQDVPLAFNYPYLMIGLGILAGLLIVAFFVFGKTIRKKIRLYRLRKEYEKFSASFEKGISNVRKNNDVTLIEEVLLIWKRYMEKLEDKPFTKYTTREILNSGYDQLLKDVLRSIDRSIYGRIDDEEMHKNFESLEDFTLDRYKLRIINVSNG